MAKYHVMFGQKGELHIKNFDKEDEAAEFARMMGAKYNARMYGGYQRIVRYPNEKIDSLAHEFQGRTNTHFERKKVSLFDALFNKKKALK